MNPNPDTIVALYVSLKMFFVYLFTKLVFPQAESPIAIILDSLLNPDMIDILYKNKILIKFFI